MTTHHRSTFARLAIAGLIGTVLGAGSVVGESSGGHALAATARDVGVAAGLVRRRAPQPGDSWGGCNDARAAGTAPIYRGEPGYRSEMDGDADGIACEPPRS